jgi:hypothetical protein
MRAHPRFVSSVAISLAALAGLALSPATADAYSYAYYCNGCPGSIGGTSVGIYRNQPSIPNGSPRLTSYNNAANTWNVASWNPAVPTGVTTDSVINYGDGQWEVGVVADSSIPGLNGLTTLQYGVCFIGCNDIDEADIVTRAGLDYLDPDESQLYESGRMTMLHEWGHLLGLGHQAAFHVMNSSQPNPFVGGTGSHVQPMCDDRSGIRNLYGTPGSFRNLAASAQKWQSGIVSTTYVGTKVFCTGGTEWVSFTTENFGLLGTSFNTRWSLHTSTLGYTGGYSAFFLNSAYLAPAVGGTWNIQMVMPSIPTGVYRTFHNADHDGIYSETVESDNFARHPLIAQKLGC